MRKQQGFTLIEMLITLGVIGIMLAMVGLGLRVPKAQLFANEVQSLMAQARLQAIKLNRPVAVVWNEATHQFEMKRDEADELSNASVSGACDSDTTLGSTSANEFDTVEINSELPGGGIVWLPNALLTTCDGIPDSEIVIALSDGRTDKELVISVTGKVTVE